MEVAPNNRLLAIHVVTLKTGKRNDISLGWLEIPGLGTNPFVSLLCIRMIPHPKLCRIHGAFP